MNESEEKEEVKTVPLYQHMLHQLDVPVMQDT